MLSHTPDNNGVCWCISNHPAFQFPHRAPDSLVCSSLRGSASLPGVSTAPTGMGWLGWLLPTSCSCFPLCTAGMRPQPRRARTPTLLPTPALFLRTQGGFLSSWLALGAPGTARCCGTVAKTDPAFPPGALKICCNLSEK